MNRSRTLLFLTLVLILAANLGCSDKDSPEACQYETTMNLDAHNYDAVLLSPCATTMQLAAAHFGKAGYDLRAVINRFIDAKSAAGDRDLGVYMGSLVSRVTAPALGHLSHADLTYASIPSTADEYRDAQFLLSLVRAVRAMAIIKTIINGDGTGVLSSCDINTNGIPDEADAVSCAFKASGQADPTTGSCLLSAWTGTWSATTDIIFSGQTGTYRGLLVTIPALTAPGACPTDYEKMLHLSSGPVGTGTYRPAITVGTCPAFDALTSNPAGTWPCPSEAAQDVLSSFQADVSGAVSSLATSLTATTEVRQSIEDIRTQACGVDGVCTADELAAYIQDRL